MKFKVSALMLMFWLTACSTLPETIQVADGTNLVSYQNAASQAEAMVGKQARWGGVIAKVENKQDHTMLEVLYYPLRSYGRPSVSDESMGRFRVNVQGFMDPMVYQKGRTMTFVGTLNGLEEGLVGEHTYVFPVLNANGYHLWKDIQTVDVTRIHVWPYDYWHGWHLRPHHSRVYIRSSGHRSGNSTGPSSSTPAPKPVQKSNDIR